jgi:hypothetical protein
MAAQTRSVLGVGAEVKNNNKTNKNKKINNSNNNKIKQNIALHVEIIGRKSDTPACWNCEELQAGDTC